VIASAPALAVVGILADADASAVLRQTVTSAGDSLALSESLAEGLARVSTEVPDVALVDVALGQNAGLAVIHHIRALAPHVAIYALTRQSGLELGSAAMALGATGVLVMPLTGDDVLTALSGVRSRRAEQEQVREVLRRVDTFGLERALFARVAELAECMSRREACERLLRAVAEAGARRALVYLPAGEGSRELMRTAQSAQDLEAPAFCEELELLGFAEDELDRLLDGLDEGWRPGWLAQVMRPLRARLELVFPAVEGRARHRHGPGRLLCAEPVAHCLTPARQRPERITWPGRPNTCMGVSWD